MRIHELEFTDREARPATWRARCGAEDVPLEQTTSVPENITCPACTAAASLEELVRKLEDCACTGTPGLSTWKRKRVRDLTSQIIELSRKAQEDDHGEGPGHSG